MNIGKRKWVTVLAASVAGVLLLHTAWNTMAGRALRMTILEQSRKGYPASMRDLLPGAISDRTDASEPLRKAYALIEQGREEGRGRHALTMRLLAFHDGSRRTADPSFSLPRLDANRKKSLWQMADGDVMRPVYDLLEEASRRPNCRFEPDLSLGIAAVPRDVLQMKSCIQLLMLRSWLNSDAGRHGAAVTDIATALRLCAFMESYPLLVTQLQRVSAGGVVLGRLADALESAPPGALSQSDLGELDLAVGLLRDMDHVGLARAIDGERIMYGAWLAEGILRGRALSSIGATVPRWLRWYSFYPARPLLKSDIRIYLETMAAGRDYVRLSRAERMKRPDPSAGVGSSSPLAHALLPSFSRLADRMDMFDTAVEQARAGVVLARFYREHKYYPKSWSETGVSEIPDPMGGKLAYFLQGKSFLIVSVGPNGLDDRAEGDDIVWPARK